MGSGYVLTALEADVRITKIVSDDDQDVRFVGGPTVLTKETHE
jgi:hypothetical protein